MLTQQDLALIADLRANAAATGEDDERSKSELRRGQRRLLAIIDRLAEPAAFVIKQPLSAGLLAEIKRRSAHIVIEEGAELMQALEACRLLVKWHSNVFDGGRQALRFDNGYPVDRTDVDEAARLAKEAIAGEPLHLRTHSTLDLMKLQGLSADEIARELLCDDCPPDDYCTDKTRCRECPRRKESAA